MSDVQDLGRTAAITPGQMALYVKAVNAERPCPACGSKEWTMWPEPDGATGFARGVVMVACDQCNAVRMFLRPAIVTWLKGARDV